MLKTILQRTFRKRTVTNRNFCEKNIVQCYPTNRRFFFSANLFIKKENHHLLLEGFLWICSSVGWSVLIVTVFIAFSLDAEFGGVIFRRSSISRSFFFAFFSCSALAKRWASCSRAFFSANLTSSLSKLNFRRKQEKSFLLVVSLKTRKTNPWLSSEITASGNSLSNPSFPDSQNVL